MTPVLYANDDGKGRYIGLVPISMEEYVNTLNGMATRNEDATDFLSRVFYLWKNPNPVIETGNQAS